MLRRYSHCSNNYRNVRKGAKIFIKSTAGCKNFAVWDDLDKV